MGTQELAATLQAVMLAERRACVRYLRAEADVLEGIWQRCEVVDVRVRLLSAVDALKIAADAIEAGAEEAFFGVDDPR